MVDLKVILVSPAWREGHRSGDLWRELRVLLLERLKRRGLGLAELIPKEVRSERAFSLASR